jgi:hypothetical protein
MNTERPGFEKELEALINKYSKENDSNTPDFILARYLVNCMENYSQIVTTRDNWFRVQPHTEPLKEI